jgi:PAS domain S-box-containing protein
MRHLARPKALVIQEARKTGIITLPNPVPIGEGLVPRTAVTDQEFRHFYDASPLLMGAVELLPDGDIRRLYDNPAASDYFKRSSEVSEVRTARELGVDADLLALWRERYVESARLGRSLNFEYVHQLEPGDPRTLSVTITPLSGGPPNRFSYVAEDVTERRQTLERLRHQETRYEMALDAARMGDWRWDVKSGLMQFSPRAAAIYGVPPGAEMTWDELSKLIPGVDDALARSAIELARTHGAYEMEYRVRRPSDGKIVWVGLRGRGVFDANGKITAHIGMAWDQTRLKSVEMQLRREGAKALELQRQHAFRLELSDALRPLADSEAILMTAAGMLGEFLKVQTVGFARATNEPNAFEGESHWTEQGVVRDGSRRRMGDFGAPIREALVAGRRVAIRDIETEAPWSTPEGRAAYGALGMRASVSVAQVKDGKTCGFFYVLSAKPHDWSAEELELIEEVAARSWAEVDRARAERALRDSEERFRAFMAHSLMSAWIIDRDGMVRYLSPGYYRMFDVPGDLAGRNVAELYPLEMVDETRRNNLLALHEDRLVEAVERGVRPDGSLGEFITFRFPLRLGDEVLLGGMALDITETRRAQADLRESEERLRLATDSTGVGIYDIDLSTGAGRWTDRAFEVLGLVPPVDRVGSFEKWRAALHPDDVEKLLSEHDRALSTGSSWRAEYRIRRHDDGGVRWLETLGAFVKSDDRVRSVGVVADITDRKRLEEHQQLLLHELNHRVKNTLAIIQSITRQTLVNAGAAPHAREALENRLGALASAHDVLTREKWESASLRQAVEGALSGLGVAPARTRLEGPDVALAPKTFVSIAMAIHELGTNAVKYGSLSNAEGRVVLKWSVADGRMRLEWREEGGPLVSTPSRRGFGTRLIQRGLAAELAGRVDLEFRPEGLICRIDAPVPALQ